MSESFFVVHNANGVILRNGICDDEDLALQAKEGETVFISEQEIKGATHYMEAGAPLEKTLLPHTVAGNQITGLPIPCTALGTFNGTYYEITDGVITLETDEPGDYEFYISALKHIAQFVTITIL